MGVVSEALVPGTWSLLEAIEGLVKPTNMLRMNSVDEARWLLAVDHLLEIAVEKGILEIGQAQETAMLSTTRIMVGLTTGLKVSSKSTLGC